jgi:hypothetical protein
MHAITVLDSLLTDLCRLDHMVAVVPARWVASIPHTAPSLPHNLLLAATKSNFSPTMSSLNFHSLSAAITSLAHAAGSLN